MDFNINVSCTSSFSNTRSLDPLVVGILVSVRQTLLKTVPFAISGWQIDAQVQSTFFYMIICYFFVSTEMSVALYAYFKGGYLKTTPEEILKHFCKKMCHCMSMRSFQLKQSKLSTSVLWKELKISLYTSYHSRRFVLCIYLCHSESF